MNRREFITLLGGAAAAWPLAARAQHPAKLPTIGFFASATSETQGRLVAAFVQRLRELGCSLLELGEVQAAARTLGLDVITSEIQRAEDIVPAFEALNGRAEALYVCIDPLVVAHRIRINTLALAARLPTMHSLREYVEAGGLMSYGPNVPDLFRRAADYVDKILRGTKPADLPVEQPTKLDLIINLTTAKALGLNMPPTLLARADEVIE
jgi:putative ABC transport system substrate-binding protein